MQVTVVYEMADDTANHLISAAKTNIECGQGSILACYQGDAMAERDDLEKGQKAYNAVISYMLGKGYMESPMEFLQCWNSGDFDSLRKEWPDAPPEIYYADPLAK